MPGRTLTMACALRIVPAALMAAAITMTGGSMFARAGLEQSDLDRFMADVLARRDDNWKKLQQYLLDEREDVRVDGPGGMPLWGEKRTYTWFIRDGFFVRSPLVANGVTIGETERRKYEDDFLRRARDRETRDASAANPSLSAEVAPSDPPRDLGGLLSQSRQPQFIDTAYFLRFTFEAGKYAFVGRESLNGEDVLRIEYYPARLFTHEQDAADTRRAAGRQDRGEDAEAARERLMNKAALVTLWVAPRTQQIVKYAFDNVNLDFLPAAWLLRVTDLEATMTMGQPFAGVWLPREVDMHVSGLLAIGAIEARYRVEYLNYREAATAGRLVPAHR